MNNRTISPESAAGPLIIIGGRFETDSYAILDEIKRLASGRIGVLGTASEFAEASGSHSVNAFKRYGLDAVAIPLFWEKREQAAFDPDIVAMFEQVNAVYFTGGDQRRIQQTFIQNGAETKALEALRGLHGRGGLIAGSSAGAAMMSDPMIMGGSSLTALSRGVVEHRERNGLALGEGLGFFGWGITDQHFIRRGRLARLVVALQATGRRYGFGIDENTALVVEGNRARVVGETGVIFIDASRARYGSQADDVESVWMSYLDDGDAIDLTERKVEAHAAKKPLAISADSFKTAVPAKGNAFGAYRLHELMFRLAQGNPEHYAVQNATAYDRAARTRITVEMEHDADRSEVYVSGDADDDDSARHTIVDFRLSISVDRQVDDAKRRPVTYEMNPATSGDIYLLGSSPVGWRQDVNQTWLKNLPEPVGIIAAASVSPSRVAQQYLQWLTAAGKQAEVLDLTRANSSRRSKDETFLQRIGEMRSLIFTGGAQRRLVRTLFKQGESTRVFRRIQQAYNEGVSVIGVGAAASAFGTRMIAEGSSRQALLCGSTEDAGHDGVLMDEGLGFIRTGLIDQNFVKRHRLGRLIVACAEEGFDLGLGLSENCGIRLDATQREFSVFGDDGVYVAQLDLEKLRLDEQIFSAQNIALEYIAAANKFYLESDRSVENTANAQRQDLLNELVAGLQKACGVDQAVAGERAWLQAAITKDNPARLSIQSSRAEQ